MNALAKIIRIAAILLVGLTAAVALLSGAGTTCVALGAEKYESMLAILPYKWLYVFYVLATLAASVYALFATVELVRSQPGAYRDAVISMLLVLVFGLAQVITSRALRGKSMPNDLRVYLSLFTLIVLGLLRIPPIWQQVGLGGSPGGAGRLVAGTSLFAAGISVLTVQYWAGPTHTFGGLNLADVWQSSLAVVGWGLLTASIYVFIRPMIQPALPDWAKSIIIRRYGRRIFRGDTDLA